MTLAGANFTVYKTWNDGETLYAADLNSSFTKVLSNLNPAGIASDSPDLSTMRATQDPYPGSNASLAASLEGELQRIRYILSQITGKTYWYQDPDVSLAVPSDSTKFLRGDATWAVPAYPTPSFTKRYGSGPQTITPGGFLTLAHSLGGFPEFIQTLLYCNSTDCNYSAGEYLYIPSYGHYIFQQGQYSFAVTGAMYGCSVSADTTNIYVRFAPTATASLPSASSATFIVPDKNTGSAVAITNSKWSFTVRAWYI